MIQDEIHQARPWVRPGLKKLYGLREPRETAIEELIMEGGNKTIQFRKGCGCHYLFKL